MEQEPSVGPGKPAGGNPLSELRHFFAEFEAHNPEFGANPIAPETRAEYVQVAWLAINRCDPPILSGFSSSYRVKIRVSIRYVGWRRIYEILELIEHGGIDPDEARPLVEEGHEWRLRIIAVQADTGEARSSSNTMRRTSRRKKLAKLPEGWETTFFGAARRRPEWFNGICVMLAVGARPIEIQRGVIVRRLRDGIEIAVPCAKQPRHPGASSKPPEAKWRYLELSDDTPWANALIEALGDKAKLVVTWPSAKKAYDQVVSIAKEVGMTAPRSISPYVFRHRFGCLLKSQKFSNEEISMALGHTDGDIKSTYGTWNGRHSRGGRPLSIRSDLNVNAPRKDRRFTTEPDDDLTLRGPD